MRFPRYRAGARWYDVLSLERLLYRRARLRAIELLALRPAQRVLDVGCGTGLSLPPVLSAVGPDGRVVGVDASAAMLARARRRADDRVQLVRADADDLAAVVDGPFDAVLFCYSLSVVPHWQDVWAAATAMLSEGGRAAVVDTAYPRGLARVLAPLAWLFLRAGGVHPRRRVWDVLGPGAVHEQSLAGHVQLAVGTVR